jgi:hypothetical protein
LAQVAGLPEQCCAGGHCIGARRLGVHEVGQNLSMHADSESVAAQRRGAVGIAYTVGWREPWHACKTSRGRGVIATVSLGAHWHGASARRKNGRVGLAAKMLTGQHC